MDPSQRPTSNNPPNPYGQPQAPAYGYPYGQAPPAQAFQAPQQAYYQTPAQSDVFAALAQAPPVYAPPPNPEDRARTTPRRRRRKNPSTRHRGAIGPRRPEYTMYS